MLFLEMQSWVVMLALLCPSMRCGLWLTLPAPGVHLLLQKEGGADDAQPELRAGVSKRLRQVVGATRHLTTVAGTGERSVSGLG